MQAQFKLRQAALAVPGTERQCPFGEQQPKKPTCKDQNCSATHIQHAFRDLPGELHPHGRLLYHLQIGESQAAEPKGVVDGGVTILVPTSIADSLSPVEKRVSPHPQMDLE